MPPARKPAQSSRKRNMTAAEKRALAKAKEEVAEEKGPARETQPHKKASQARARRRSEDNPISPRTGKPVTNAHRRRMEAKGLDVGRVCGGYNISGGPCGSSPLRPGTVIEGITATGDFCIRHDPDLPPGAYNRIVIEAGVVANKAKPRLPHPMELMAEAVAKAPDILFRAHLETLGKRWNPETLEVEDLEGPASKGQRIHGFSRDGKVRLSGAKDLSAQRAAEASLTDRMFGKARQALEIGAAGQVTASVTIPATADRTKQVVDVLITCGALGVDVTGAAEDQ